MRERSTEDWDAVIRGLEADQGKAEATLAGLAAERRPLALDAAIGDTASAKALAVLTEREVRLRAQVAGLSDALADAQERRAGP